MLENISLGALMSNSVGQEMVSFCKKKNVDTCLMGVHIDFCSKIPFSTVFYTQSIFDKKLPNLVILICLTKDYWNSF